MSIQTHTHPRGRTLLHGAALAVVGSVILAIAAHTKVPMWPVPITLQTLAVMVIGLTYGGRLAAATLTLYLFEGVMGLPVFTNGAGIMALMSPTGGYLIGFLMAATFLGFASDRGLARGVPGMALSLLVATALIYVPGLLWLSTVVPADKLLMAGMVPFLVGDVIKAAIAALVAGPIRKALR